MKKSLLIIIISLPLLSAEHLFGEGWTKKAGKGFYALDFRSLISSKYHDFSGKNIEINSLRDLAINLYSEYGLTDNFTLKINFPFYKILESNNSMGESIGNKGIGDLDLGVRYKIMNFNSTILSASLTFGIPISNDDVYGGNMLPLSDGEYNQIIGIELGHSLYPLPMYLSGSIKFNNRNEGYSDQLKLGIEGGYNIKKNLLLNLRLSFLKSLNNGDKKVESNIIPLQSNNQEYIALKMGILYNFYRNIGIAAAANFGLYAKNILSAPVFSIGIYIK